MKVNYDTYYQTENLFGEPYPELIEFFIAYPHKGKILDLGCGQGRDAVALAKLGYTVTGIDHSNVGIEQMNRIALDEGLNLVGQVGDIYSFDDFSSFDCVLLDSMFHFAKKDKEKEIAFLRKIVSTIKNGCLLVICIQDTGDKVQILNHTLDLQSPLKRLADKQFTYIFTDKKSGQSSESLYRMIVAKK